LYGRYLFRCVEGYFERSVDGYFEGFVEGYFERCMYVVIFVRCVEGFFDVWRDTLRDLWRDTLEENFDGWCDLCFKIWQ